MFSHLGFGEILVIAVVGFFIFGPDRLPKAAAEAGRMLRQLRKMANQARSDLKSELGPELSNVPIRSLHPKTMVRDLLLNDQPKASSSAPAPSAPTQPANGNGNGNGNRPKAEG
jgi:sec-independent protein translocase protein TatB